MARSPKEQDTPDVIYVRRPSRSGQPAFSDVALPDGTIIRRVDEAVHRRALAKASEAYREKLNGG